MALIVEDGSGVANANSYVSLADAKTYANAYGLLLPAVDADIEALLLRAMAYIEAQPYTGFRSSPTQALQWPRTGAVALGYTVAPNVVPAAIWQAQVQAAAVNFAGVDLMPSEVSSALVTKEKVGPIETEYSESTVVISPYGKFPQIDVYLLPYLFANSGYKLSPFFGF